MIHTSPRHNSHIGFNQIVGGGGDVRDVSIGCVLLFVSKFSLTIVPLKFLPPWSSNTPTCFSGNNHYYSNGPANLILV